ncbi:cell division protein FtsL [Limnohabitans sp.]|jgi:cell division protein FtsL|uniref:cell division protein FtsL n=1 Tax=Limnohabitans sp. TaxID=1907725 RepID=UPI002FDE0638
MSRVSVLLMIAVMASALYLVRTQYESRSLTMEIDRATSLARNLETENDRLDVERRAQATPLRVEKLAREQLHMRTITPAITHYATMPAGATASATGSASASAGVRP